MKEKFKNQGEKDLEGGLTLMRRWLIITEVLRILV